MLKRTIIIMRLQPRIMDAICSIPEALADDEGSMRISCKRRKPFSSSLRAVSTASLPSIFHYYEVITVATTCLTRTWRYYIHNWAHNSCYITEIERGGGVGAMDSCETRYRLDQRTCNMILQITQAHEMLPYTNHRFAYAGLQSGHNNKYK